MSSHIGVTCVTCLRLRLTSSAWLVPLGSTKARPKNIEPPPTVLNQAELYLPTITVGIPCENLTYHIPGTELERIVKCPL